MSPEGVAIVVARSELSARQFQRLACGDRASGRAAEAETTAEAPFLHGAQTRTSSPLGPEVVGWRSNHAAAATRCIVRFTDGQCAGWINDWTGAT